MSEFEIRNKDTGVIHTCIDGYAVITEDRHTDVQVEVFLDKDLAIKRARYLAEGHSNYSNNELLETNIDGWLYHAEWGGEGDNVHVIDAEINSII